MSKQRIAFFDSKQYDIDFFSASSLSEKFDFKFFPGKLTEDTVILTKGYDGICIFVNDIITAGIADSLIRNGIKIVALRCAGYNNIDLKSVYGKIHVVRVPAYSPHAVAEHAVALMMTLNRKIHKAYSRTRDNNFTLNGLLGFDMYGKTAGIIGTGQIGKITAQILCGFGMNVLAYDPFEDRTWAAKNGISYHDKDFVFRNADIISLHCPLTAENTYLINRASLEIMKPGAMIINTGRGLLINSRDLLSSLKKGHIGAAGLDVYEEETEYFFEDRSSDVIQDDTLARLMTFPNVIITSHQAFFTKEALESIANTTCMNLASFFDDGSCPNEICYKCSKENCQRKITGKCF